MSQDNVYYLTPRRQLRLPITPPPFRNHGNYIISLNQFTKWLAGQVEAEGIDLFWGFAGQSVLFDGQRVIGVRTGDRGVGKDGQPRGMFEPGADIQAKVTIFADGVRGHLTKELMRVLQLGEHSEPAQFAIGLKELWEIPRDRLAPGTVIHTLGYPLRQEEFGGSWLYAMPDGRDLDRLRRRPRLPGSAARSVLGLPALQAAPLHRRHPGRRAGGALRRQGAARGRLEHAAAPVHGRRPDRRGRRELRELDAAQGHPPGHAQRHAGGRDGVRRRSRAGDTSARRCRRYKARVDASAIKDGAVSGARRPPGVRRRALCGQRVRGAGDDDRRAGCRATSPAMPATPG